MEAAVDFAILTKKEVDDLVDFITFCWNCLNHASDVVQIILELIVDISADFDNEYWWVF